MQTFIVIDQNNIVSTSDDRIHTFSVYNNSRDYYNCNPLHRTSLSNASEEQLEAMADKLAERFKACSVQDARSVASRFNNLSARYSF